MKNCPWLVFILFCFLLSLLFKGSLSHILYWHEQHELFRFSELYFSGFLTKPAGLINYFSAFCIQFFYYPLWGSILMSILLASVYILNDVLVVKLSGSRDKLFLSLVPALFLLMQYCSIEFPISVVVGIVLNQLTFIIFLSFSPQKRNYFLYIFLLILFYISGFFCCVFLIYTIIYLILRKSPFSLLAFLAFFITLIFLGGYYYRVSIIEFLSKNQGEVSINFFLFGLLVPPFLSAHFLLKQLSSKKILTIYISILCIGFYSVAGLWVLFKFHNPRARLMLNVDKNLKKANWETILELTKKYKGKNQLVCYLNNLALFHTGRMSEDLFKYPQEFGVNSLYFVWDGTSKMVEYGDLVFANLGYYNEATRWAFESMVIYGETAPVLKKLIDYNLCNNKPLVAQRFINILKESLFYSEQAHFYEKNLSSGRQVVMHNDETQNIFANFLNISNDLLYLCDTDPENKMAFEYLMAYYLLSNKVIDFVNNLWRIKIFDYKQLPKPYEEALFLFKVMYQDEFNSLNIHISEYSQNQFREYSKLYSDKNYEELKRSFQDTYWYYIHFTSPYGNKIIRN